MSHVYKPVRLVWTIILHAPAIVLLFQFADGVYLVLLMGLLEGYFVPLYNFFLTPENFDQKVNGG